MSRKEKFICYCNKGKQWFYTNMERPIYYRTMRFIKKVLLVLVMIFSPFLIWLILCLNRELIVIMANSQWFSARFPVIFDALGEHVNTYEFANGFNEAALGGLLTLFGVVVTVWYYHVTRAQEVTEKRLFVIDEILQELKKNRRVITDLNCEDYQLLLKEENALFYTDTWHKMGADVALLPRRIHMRLSVLYGYLARCDNKEDYQRHKAAIDRLPGIITDLHKYRTSLSKPDIVVNL